MTRTIYAAGLATAPPLPLDYAACQGRGRDECAGCMRLALSVYIIAGKAGDGRYSYTIPMALPCELRIPARAAVDADG